MSSNIIGAEICRRRGDTVPDVLMIMDPANPLLPLDITGFTYLLTISTLKDPPDGTTQVTQISGTVSGLLGRVQFFFSVPQASQAPGTYYYDIQQTDSSGRIKTLAKNKYIFFQDITK